MPSFLKLVVDDLLYRYNGKIDGLTLVFPSHRAGLFFQKYLAERIDKPVWTPKSVSISEVMFRISGFRKTDSITLVAKLFEIYQTLKASDEPFDCFYFWGEVMLDDFDQIDKYRIDAARLYSNVKDIKDIEERFGGLTPEQAEVIRRYLGVISDSNESRIRNNFLSIWNILGEIYNKFTNRLAQEGNCYEGLAFRIAAQKLSAGSSDLEVPQNMVFIGFNALNSCEHELFRYCKKLRNALFYWDFDPAFIDNPIHEAGVFLRENLNQYPNALNEEVFRKDSQNNSEISLIAAPSTVTQAKLIPKIFAEIKQKGGMLDVSTAVVFPLENLLIPTLQSIPADIEQLNITMGYPLKETPAYSLAELMIRLQINKRKQTDGTFSFYYKDILSLLNHPYVRICEPTDSVALVTAINQNNMFYSPQSMFNKSSFLSSIFSSIEHSKDLSQYILGVCHTVAKTIASSVNDGEESSSSIDLEFLYALHKSLMRLDSVLSNQNFGISHRLFLQLLRKVFVQERVSFTGEPLAGLQLMGFLETRALDFENLIILSFNDDIIPGRSHPVSFITPSLRFGYGLPDYKHQNAVYAYYFYRLLNRAKRVFLVYSTRTEGLSSGEKSRFALQLEYEQLVGKIKTIPIHFDVDLTPQQPIVIEKSEKVIHDLIKNITKDKGVTLSPSGLTTYLTCSLRYYFRYCVGLFEPDEITEEVGAQDFGNIIHKTMEHLYKPMEGNTVTTQFIDNILKNVRIIEETVDSLFADLYFKNKKGFSISDLSGRNILARNAIIFTIKRMLGVDLKRAPFMLIRHEQRIHSEIDTTVMGTPARIILEGFIDRIEKKDNTLWIIDYKTGNPKDKGKFNSISDLFDPKRIDKVKEVFQIFCYSLAATSEYKNMIIKPALWFVKDLKPGDQPKIKVKVDSKNSRDVDDFLTYKVDFEIGLQNLVNEIFDSSKPFSQTEKTERCKSCPYIGICGKD